MTIASRPRYAARESIVRRPRWTPWGPRRAVSAAAALAVLVCALSACPTVDLGDQPEDPPLCDPGPEYFESAIWPQYLAPTDIERSCVGKAGCHNAVNGRSALRLDATDPIDYGANYQAVRRFLNCSTPLSSRLVTEPLAGGETHGGGDIFPSPDDPAVVAFEQWFAQ
jgi:hypothetical protein